MARQYAAFLSYSHHDAAAARWLHTALEEFPVPHALVGTPGQHGFVPQRIAPIFRDDADLPATGDLSAEVTKALADSDALVVICSEHAAQSAWVAEEVRRFKAQHGDRRVFAVVLHFADCHEPTAVMPLPLKRRVLSDGTVTDEPTEPLALALDGPDGRKATVRRLAAGLLGVNLDALVQRDSARRQRHLLRVAAVLLVALIGTALLARSAFVARDAAETQRAEAEQLISFMLGDLRAQAEKSGRLDMLDSVALKVLGYYQRQPLADLSADSLSQRAAALNLIGQTRMLRGDYPASERAFDEAEATTGELMAREPADPKRIFDHAQSVFWQGNLARERSDYVGAGRAFTRYATLADALVAAEPENADYRAEVGHSRNNLGVAAMDAGDYDTAAKAFRAGTATFRSLALGAGPGSEFEGNLADSLAWLADALRRQGELREAQATRREELIIRSAQSRRDPVDMATKNKLAWAEDKLAELALDLGEPAEARPLADKALAAAEQLVQMEPNNLAWQSALTSMSRHRAEISVQAGYADAPQALLRAEAELNTLRERDQDGRAYRAELARYLVLKAEHLRGAGELAAAAATGAKAIDALESAGLRTESALRIEARLLAGDRSSALSSDVTALRNKAVSLSIRESCVLLAGLRTLGDTDAAGPIAKRIEEAHYRRSPCVTLR